jgi:hypothetical protein
MRRVLMLPFFAIVFVVLYFVKKVVPNLEDSPVEPKHPCTALTAPSAFLFYFLLCELFSSSQFPSLTIIILGIVCFQHQKGEDGNI